MRYYPLHCWDCGTRVIEQEKLPDSETRICYALPVLRLVRFDLADGTYCESPFCEACAAEPWPPERCQVFEDAVNQTSPIQTPIRVVRQTGVSRQAVTVLA